MKKIMALWIAMLVALVVLSGAAPRDAGAATSPLATPQLTPPYRPTPTGWPYAPFPTVAPRPAGGRGDKADRWVSRGWFVPMTVQ